jgi:hypothetical protein
VRRMAAALAVPALAVSLLTAGTSGATLAGSGSAEGFAAMFRHPPKCC